MRADGRSTASRPKPSNKLSETYRQLILEVANSAEFASLPPSQIVPSLADRGVYLASESSFYRVLRSASTAPPRSGTAAFVTDGRLAQINHRVAFGSLRTGWTFCGTKPIFAPNDGAPTLRASVHVFEMERCRHSKNVEIQKNAYGNYQCI
ncbi:hypothetical protein OKW46_000998 [Paraburkholderia sp. WSM4179]|nr:hypothetical protein [Paraburkholderia sp. WSM4179]